MMANDNLLQIILVSSEGTIFSLIERMSAMNRGFIYEIGNLGNDEVIKYMMKNVPKDEALEVVQCLGEGLSICKVVFQ